jgi:hypothetical protein
MSTNPRKGKKVCNSSNPSATIPAMPDSDTSALINALISRLPGNICVVDGAGVIIAVNSSWLQFAQANGARPLASVGAGVNYLLVCDAAALSGDSYAAAVLDGLRAVLDGSRSGFDYEYPCNSPQLERWYQLQISPLPSGFGGAVLCHSNISALRRAQIAQLGAPAKADSIVSMCSFCKRIKQDETHWQEIEAYLYEAFDQRFSHGLCAECMERMYPEFTAELAEKRS